MKNPPPIPSLLPPGPLKTWVILKVRRRLNPQKEADSDLTYTILLDELGEVDALNEGDALAAARDAFPLVSRGDLLLGLKVAKERPTNQLAPIRVMLEKSERFLLQ